MADVRFLLKEKVDWQGAMVLLAFPSAGSASSIAAHYLRRRLDLPLVGSIHLEGQSPVAAVYDGIATSPIRVHGGQPECKLGDESCPWVYLISSDLPLQSDAIARVGDAIMQESRGARLVLCLDAIPRDPNDETPNMHCAGSNAETVDLLKADDVKPMGEAILVGMSGQILLGAEAADLAAGALLVEAEGEVPDGRAAAVLIEAVDRLLPTIDIDAKPLLEEALELEQEIAKTRARAERAQASHGSSSTYI